MMQEFIYRVREKKTGQWREGVITGEDEGTAIRTLQSQGFVVVSIKPKATSLNFQKMVINMQRVSLHDLVVFTRQFATMLRAGVALTRALGILGEETKNKRLKLAIEDIRREVESGTALSQALSKHKDIFPRLYISLVKVGEAGGFLDVIFERLASYYEKNEETNRKIKSAAAYPLAIIIIAVVMVIFLLTYVLPTFLNLLTSFNAPLPLPTKIVMSLSNFFRSYWYVIASIIIVLYLLFRILTSKPKGKKVWDIIVLKVPIIGRLTRLMVISRLCHTLSMLISGGVPLVTALEVLKDTMDSTPYMETIDKTRQQVTEGGQLSTSFVGNVLFPPMLGYMTAVGEESGVVDEMLERVGLYYDDEVNAMISTITSLVEPILIVFIGGIIGFIVISMYMPIFQIIQTVGNL